jgi:hypothetical protein
MSGAFQPPPDYTRREVDAVAGTGCPFYGASLTSFGQLVRFPGSPNNRCALITNAHSPCWMEVAENRAPDWAECPRNPEFVTEVIRDARAEARFNQHCEYMDSLRVQRGIMLARREAGNPS